MTLVPRRPKGTELTILRWVERTAAAPAVAYELRCVSSATPYVVERFPRPGNAELFARDVYELAQEDTDARQERSEYHLVQLGDTGGAVVDDAAPLATHLIRCMPREPAERGPDVGAGDALKVVLDQNNALLKSYLSLATSAMAEIQRVSSSAIEASRGLLAPLVKRVEALEAENAELRSTAREAEAVIAMAGATEVNEEREERRTASMEKLAAAVLTHLAQKEPKLAMLINEVVGTPKKGD